MPKILWHGAEIAAATQGVLSGEDFTVTGISIDTRTLQPGDLFIALKGPQFDGHDYIEAAIARGAAGILAQKKIADRTIVVADTFRALHDLGAAARERSHAKIVAVTGSVGKTSVKAMLAETLGSVGKTHAAEASLNNHWGVPLSLARMPKETQYAVFEIGMNHAHEITPLSKLVVPYIGIITTIASAHIANLGSIENIALAKAEIFDGMRPDGIAILPRDSEQYPILLAQARTQGLQNIISFGTHEDADIRLINNQNGILHVAVESKEYHFHFGMPGAHQAVNVLSVIATAKCLGIDLQIVLPAFAAMHPVQGRGNHQQIKIGHAGLPVTIIDETHNASPIAVEAALKTLSTHTGRKIVVLGDMLELGDKAPEFHAGLAEAVKKIGPGQVLLCGPHMKNLADALPDAIVVHYPDSMALANDIARYIMPGDAVMVKGSRGSKMKLVVDALVRLGQFDASSDIIKPHAQIG